MTAQGGGQLGTTAAAGKGDAQRALFAIPDYRRGWLLGMLTGIARWLEFLAIGVFAYQLTESAPLVALLAILRLAPYALLGYFVGSFTDRIDRKRWLLIGLCAMCCISATMAYLAATGNATYTTVIFATIATGIFWLTDMPIRRRFMLDAVGTERAGRAMGFDNISNYATRGLGPLVGGIVFQIFGPVGVFGLNLAIYLVCLIVALGFTRPAVTRQPVAAKSDGPSQDTAASPRSGGDAGKASLLANPRFLIILGVTVLYNLFCIPFVAMLPVFAQKDFGFSPAAVGTLAAFEGVGGLLGSLAVGFFIRPPMFFSVYFAGPLIYMLSVLALSFVLEPGITVAALIALSIGGAFFSATQYTLIYTAAAPELRGRAFGFLSLCIGCGTLGLWNAGYLFHHFPSERALAIMAAEGLVPMLILGILAIFFKGQPNASGGR
jgi:MFS family permease